MMCILSDVDLLLVVSRACVTSAASTASSNSGFSVDYIHRKYYKFKFKITIVLYSDTVLSTGIILNGGVCFYAIIYLI